jgi:hypothetical protein
VLVVLGGAVAATAVGWLISSAAAAADTLPVHPPSVVGTALDSVGLPAESNAAPHEVPALPAPPAPAALPLPGADGVRGVTRALGSAVSQLGDRVPVDRTVVVPPLTVLPSTKAPVSTHAGQSGPAGGPTLARALRGAAAARQPAPTGSVAAQHSQVRPPAGPRSPAPPRIPAVPSAPAPFSPVTVPAAPTGGVGSAGVGGIGFADHSGTFLVPRLDSDRVVPTTDTRGHGTTGRQPGITPD